MCQDYVVLHEEFFPICCSMYCGPASRFWSGLNVIVLGTIQARCRWLCPVVKISFEGKELCHRSPDEIRYLFLSSEE